MSCRSGPRTQLAKGWVIVCALVALTARADGDPAATPSPAAAASPTATSSAASTSDNSPDFGGPGSPNLWYSLEQETSPNYTGQPGSSDQINLRAQIPLGNFAQQVNPLFAPKPYQLIKIKLPFVTAAPDETLQGYGDATLVMLEYLGRKVRRWVVGPAFKLPTASVTALGSGKWSVGPAVGYTSLSGNIEVGAYCQNFFSFAGPKSEPSVSQTQLQPTYDIAFGHSWGIGTSQMQFTYNWQRNQWTSVPLGVRLARSFASRAAQLTAGFEIEKNLVHEDGTPGWTLRFNLKYQPKRR